MKQLFTYLPLLLIFLFGSPRIAFAQYEDIPGMSCGNPVAVTEDFSIDIPVAGSYWFTAYTYDLPMHARLTVRGEYYEPVKAFVDFGCTTGSYSDKKLEQVVTSADGWGVAVPMEFEFTRTYNRDENITYYDLEISDSYRELLAQFDVTYNVQAFVNIVTRRSGHADLVPDDSFRSCIERAHWVVHPDSLVLSQATIDSIFTLPFANWQNDSVRIRWTGKEQDVVVWLGESCDFPLDQYDTRVIDFFRLSPNTYKDFSAADIKRLIDLNGKGGIYYARMLTTDSAAIIIESKPIEGPLADAIELEKEQTYLVCADEQPQYYYFRKNWDAHPLLFTASGLAPVTMYFGTTPDFTISESDQNYLGSRVFEVTNEGYTVCLSLPELTQYTKQGETDFVFVCFSSASPATITASTWNPSECVGKTVLLPTEASFEMLATRTYPTYRIRYADWVAQDMDFCLDGVSRTYFYLGDTCDFRLTTSNAHVLFFQRVDSRDTLTLTRDTLLSMEHRVDDDGYLYIQFMQGQTTGMMHVFPHPKGEGPTTNLTQAHDTSFSVVYHGNDCLVRTNKKQIFHLYNSMGTLVNTWCQNAGEQYPLCLPASGMYILRGATDSKVVIL